MRVQFHERLYLTTEYQKPRYVALVHHDADANKASVKGFLIVRKISLSDYLDVLLYFRSNGTVVRQSKVLF